MFKKLFAGIFAGLMSVSAFAWEPTKPVTVVIAYGPGSGNEILFRKIESIINKTSKINFVVEFKPGAFELIGMNHFAKAPNDGHTLYAPGVGAYYGTPVWFKRNLAQDPSEWEPVINLGESPVALFAKSDNASKDPKDVFDRMRSGGKVNIGVGAPVFVVAYEHMARVSGATQSQRIQYNSPGAVAQAVAGGEVEYGLTPLSFAIELAKAGKIKILGVTGSSRLQYPSLSAVFKELDIVAHVGLMLPKDTPKPIVDYYKKIFSAATATQEYRDFIESIHWYDSLKTPENYAKFVENQRKKWSPLAGTIEFKQ